MIEDNPRKGFNFPSLTVLSLIILMMGLHVPLTKFPLTLSPIFAKASMGKPKSGESF